MTLPHPLDLLFDLLTPVAIYEGCRITKYRYDMDRGFQKNYAFDKPCHHRISAYQLTEQWKG